MNHVLIIDKDLLTCKEIKYSLQDDITDVYYTQSVKEAIHMLQKESYSLVIMDACLSQYGGATLIQQIRQMNPLPILALSETASTADKVAALKCGADDFLNNLPTKIKDKIIYNIAKAKFVIDPELFKKLDDTDIWEFRTFYNKVKYRLLAFWDKDNGTNTLVIATHGFIKKT